MEPTDYHLNWDQFQSWAAKSVRNLIDDQNFVDVTLVSDDMKQFKAHKIILISSSPFFETILASTAHPHPLLYLKGINSEILSKLLKFVYEGEVKVSENSASDFLIAAEEIQIKGLKTSKHSTELLGGNDCKSRSTNKLEIMPEQEIVLNMKKEENILTEITEELDFDKGYEHEEAIGEIYKEEKEDINPSHSLIIGLYETDSENQLICPEAACGKTFKQRSHLDNHIKRIHVGELNFHCDSCEKKFHSKPELESHVIYAHSSEKEFDCTVCDKKFKTMRDTNKHIKAIHLKMQPYNCQFCDRKFSQSSNMHTHMRRNHFDDWARWKTSQMNVTNNPLL